MIRDVFLNLLSWGDYLTDALIELINFLIDYFPIILGLFIVLLPLIVILLLATLV